MLRAATLLLCVCARELRADVELFWPARARLLASTEANGDSGSGSDGSGIAEGSSGDIGDIDDGSGSGYDDESGDGIGDSGSGSACDLDGGDDAGSGCDDWVPPSAPPSAPPVLRRPRIAATE